MRPQFTRDQISQLDLEERHVQKAMLALPVDKAGWTAITDILAHAALLASVTVSRAGANPPWTREIADRCTLTSTED